MAQPVMLTRAAFGLVVLTFRLLGPAGPTAPLYSNTQTPYVIQQWHVLEIPLTSSWSYGNSFLEVDVTAVFTSPSGLTLTRSAFWDGGTTWKIRMAPTEPGLWRFHVSASDRDNPGLNPPDGQVMSLPAEKDRPIYAHGFLQVSANQRYLTYADGTPFFWLADTHWLFDNKERWDSANKPGWTSQFKGMVDQRVAQGFTVYQAAVFGIGGNFWAPGLIGQVIAPAYFHEQLDRKFQYVADHGLVMALALGFTQNIDGQTTTMVRFARYMVARYGAYPMVWLTGGEVAGYDPALRQSRLDGWRQVALEIERDDDYHQPQTVHYTNNFPTDYQGESWLDFTMVQGGHGTLPPLSAYAKYYDQTKPVPLVEGELNFEQIASSVTATMVRASAYRAIQAGSFGYSYGAEGIWNATWNPADKGTDGQYAHQNWYDAIDFLGAKQMSYLAHFYNDLPWNWLVPRPAGWANWSLILPDTATPVVKADNRAQDIVIYFPGPYNGLDTDGTLVNLANVDYQVRWFNPRSGTFLDAGTASIQDHYWPVPSRPDAGDWLLWLQAPAALTPDSPGLAVPNPPLHP